MRLRVQFGGFGPAPKLLTLIWWLQWPCSRTRAGRGTERTNGCAGRKAWVLSATPS